MSTVFAVATVVVLCAAVAAVVIMIGNDTKGDHR